MNNKIDAMQARLANARMKGAKSMWYLLFANTIADRLCEADTITRQEMKEIFQRRLDEARGSAEAGLLVPGYEECIERLGEFSARTEAPSGYEPTHL